MPYFDFLVFQIILFFSPSTIGLLLALRVDISPNEIEQHHSPAVY